LEQRLKKVENELKFKEEELRQLHRVKGKSSNPLQENTLNNRFPSNASFSSGISKQTKTKVVSIAINTEPEEIKTSEPDSIPVEHASIQFGRLLSNPLTNPLRCIKDSMVQEFHEEYVMPYVNFRGTGGFIDVVPRICLSMRETKVERAHYFVKVLLLGSLCYPEINTRMMQESSII
jgi:hypothetical protein